MSPSPPSSPSSPSNNSTDHQLLPLSSSTAAATTALLAPTLASPSPITALPAPNSSPFHHHLNNPNSTPPAARRFPPPCWTNEETLALIQSYRDKWFSLRRTNLRAAHWDDVAASVAERSLHLPTSTPKSAVQCRHKIEKLRKRYRAERKRSLTHDPTQPPSSPWIFFSHMESMENPNPNPNPYPNPNSIPTAIPRYQEDLDEYGDEIDAAAFYRRPVAAVANGGGGGGLKFKIPKAVRSSSRAIPIGNSSSSFGSEFDRDMRRRMEAKRMRGRGGEDDYEEMSGAQGDSATTAAAMGEMVTALRVLGDGYMRMEQMKMETAREMKRSRMEMELKRTEMILDSQMRIVDSFVKGFMGEKKVKRSAPDS